MSDTLALILLSLLSEVNSNRFEIDDLKADLLNKDHRCNYLQNDIINTFCGVK